MDICFITYDYRSQSDHLADVFAQGVSNKSQQDHVTVVDYYNVDNGQLRDLITANALTVVTGTWGSAHHLRQGNDSIGQMNQTNQRVKDLTIELNKPLLVFESPTLSRVRSTVQSIKQIHPRYYRASLGHWLYGLGEFFDTVWDHTRFERFCKLNQLLKSKSQPMWAQRSQHAPVLVLPDKNTAPTPHGITPKQWFESTIKILTASTKRPIWVKASPHHNENINYEKYAGHRITVLNKDTRLPDLLDEAWATVILDSTACFESVWRGVPVFCRPGSFASTLGNIDVTRVDTPHRPSPMSWWQKMAYTEFTQQEIQRGDMWLAIRPYIQDKILRMKQ